jgi:L-malate glycosyltransferase
MKMKRILFVCPYPENVAPSQRLKFEQYYPHFHDAGYEVVTSSYISPSFWKIIYKKGNFVAKGWYSLTGYLKRIADLLRLRKYDIVYVHLWVTPFGPPVFEWLFRKIARKLVYDIDDLVYLKNVESKAHPLVTLIKGRKKPLFLMKTADHVITCTPYLDQFVRKFNKNTTDISSTIDTNKYLPKKDYGESGKIIIGWSGSHSTSKYLHLLDDVFRDLARSFSFKLLVMGDENFTLDGVEVEAIPWKECYEVEVIRRFDIGVYPLPEEEWVLGKSGLKALQYMAAGIPTVATAIGTIFRIIKHKDNGFLVHSELEWKQFLMQLLSDVHLRYEIGKKAICTVEKKFSVDVTKHAYLSILNELSSESRHY